MTAVASAGARYAIDERIAAGGMASVHFGLLRGPAGFSRVVAIKKLHAQFAHDPEFVTMLLDEARMASRVVHPNVVSTLDVVHEGDEVLLVLEYVPGEALSRLLATAKRRGERMPPAVAVAIASGLLQGLHAAHEARDDRGAPLELVHRDVSPQNVLVGADGTPKVLDFGVAKARGRSQVTREGELKGKLPYMAPEHIKNGDVSRQSDVWSAAVVLWEMLTGERLFAGESDGHVYSRVVTERIKAPSSKVKELPPALDAAVMRGLARPPEERFATAKEMALALEAALAPATPVQVGAWVEATAGDALAKRAELLREIERRHRDAPPPSVAPPPSRAAADVDPAPLGSAPSAASAASLASSSAAARSRARSIGLVATGVLAFGALAALATLRATASSSPAASAVASAEPPRPPVASADSASAATVATASASREASASDTATAPAPATSTAPTGDAHRRAAAPRVAKPKASGSAQAPRGNRCHTVDAAGIWHVKPECL